MVSREAQAVQTLFKIQNKQGEAVDFNLNPAQCLFDQTQLSHNRVLIAKARQKGFSSIVKALHTVRCLGKTGTHAVVMSHEAGATQRHMDQVQFFLKHIKGPKPQFGRNSRQELYFPKLESTYYIGTAGARSFGRGDWITDLHCSEYAFWEDAEKHHAGVFQAVPMSGRIVIESTGNGRNNDFYYMWRNADDLDYVRLFYPWFGDTEYRRPLLPHVKQWKPDVPRYNSFLLSLQAEHKLDDEQMNWYEYKLKELRENIKMLKQEYPSTPEECFQATGTTFFNVERVKTEMWQEVKEFGYGCNKLVTHPVADLHYIFGGDPSGGTGNDDAAIIGFCCETGEQVFELFNPNINPVDYAELLIQIGKHYNEAFLIPESNNHGITVVAILKEGYSKSKIYKSKLATSGSKAKYGWQNTNQTKHFLIGMMIEDLPEVIIHGAQTEYELNSFEEQEDGKLQGDSDNCVIATGLSLLGLRKFEYMRGAHIPKTVVQKAKVNYSDTSFDEIIGNLERRRGGSGYPGLLGKQTGPGYPSA